MSISEHTLRALAEDFIETNAIASQRVVYIEEIDEDLRRRLGKEAGGIIVDIRYASKRELEDLNKSLGS